MGKINSRTKGKTGELEIAAILRDAGYEARRGQQFAGGGDSPDVMGLPGFHLEVKRVEQFRMWDAIDQANRDAKEGNTPVVVHRKNKRDWVAILSLKDFLKIIAVLDIITEQWTGE